ncbi:PIN domain-containing protein [Kribbella aluminosa]|uniref:PIN domain-containing protein n=1 Tax=Kribbella aluminosa TaxID=416017 RepID=UPI001AE588CE
MDGPNPRRDLPDADDRHVLAAAIKVHAQVIVTENIKDFRRAVCGHGTSKLEAPTTSCWT